MNQSISEGVGELNLTHDYKYDSGEILIEKDDEFVVNGNGHTIEGVSNCHAFDMESKDYVIFNNLTFRNCHNFTMTISAPTVFNNVKFINCSGKEGQCLFFVAQNLTVNNCYFELDDGAYTVIRSNGPVIMNNSLFTDGNISGNIVYVNRAVLIVENTTFENITSRLAAAINYKGSNLVIKKSKFLNLHALLSSGAIIGKYFPIYEQTDGNVAIHPFLIEDCEFINCTSPNDGGAIYFDRDSGSHHIKKKSKHFKIQFY